MYIERTSRRGVQAIGGRFPAVVLGPTDRVMIPHGLEGLDGFGSWFKKFGTGVVRMTTLGMFDPKKMRFYVPFSGGQVRTLLSGTLSTYTGGLVQSDKFFGSKTGRLIGNIGAGVEAAAAAVVAGGAMGVGPMAGHLGPGFGAAAAPGVVVPTGMPGAGMTLEQMAASGQFTQAELGQAAVAMTQANLPAAQAAAGIASSGWGLPTLSQVGSGALQTMRVGNELLGTYGNISAAKARMAGGGQPGGGSVIVVTGSEGQPQGYVMSPTGVMTPVSGYAGGGGEGIYAGGGGGGGGGYTPTGDTTADTLQQTTGMSTQTALEVSSWLPYIVIGAGVLGVLVFTRKATK